MTLVSTRAVLLRSFPFSETSRVLHFYTESLGAVAAMGRGVRTGSGKGVSGLATFVEGELTLHVKATRELHTMRDLRTDPSSPDAGGRCPPLRRCGRPGRGGAQARRR